jgi:hypothetical protein
MYHGLDEQGGSIGHENRGYKWGTISGIQDGHVRKSTSLCKEGRV